MGRRYGQLDACRFVKVLHHENGHRQSLLSPREEGGWGHAEHDLYYVPQDDKDGDGISDSFEAKNAAQNYGFQHDKSPQGREADKERHEDWDHHDTPDQWGLGSGKTVRNEAIVGQQNRRDEIDANDWSDVGPNHK